MIEDPVQVVSSISSDAASNLRRELSALSSFGATDPDSILDPLVIDSATFGSLQRSAIAKATVAAATLLSSAPLPGFPDIGIGKRLRTGELSRARRPPTFYWREHSDWDALVVGALSPL